MRRLKSRITYKLGGNESVTSNALDTEESILVLRRLIKAKRIAVPDEVLDFIANRPHNEERELDRDLMRVVAYSSIAKEDISVNVAERALRNLSPYIVAASALKTGSALDAPIAESILRLDADDKGLHVQERASKQESLVQDKETPVHTQRSSVNQHFGALLQGILFATGSLLSMLLMCLINAFTFHKLNILTQTYMWLWWFFIVLNATTILIPIDVTLTLWRRSRSSQHLRTSVYTVTVLHCVVIPAFLIILFRFQHFQLTLYHSLGFM